MITFNTDGMVAQRFPFPAPIMDYIFKNLQPQHLIKLYQCCKFFYAKYGLNIIQNLAIVATNKPESFHPTSTSIRMSNPALSKLSDFWITESFSLQTRKNGITIPFFTSFTIKKLELLEYILSEEFEMLTKAGTIEEMKIKGVYGENDFVDIKDIIEKVPKATSIEIYDSKITEATATSLSSLNHKVKLTNVVLKNIYDFPFYQAKLFRDFFLKNAVYDCRVHLDFLLVPELNDFDREYNDEILKFGIWYSELIAEALNLKKKEDDLEIELKH